MITQACNTKDEKDEDAKYVLSLNKMLNDADRLMLNYPEEADSIIKLADTVLKNFENDQYPNQDLNTLQAKRHYLKANLNTVA